MKSPLTVAVLQMATSDNIERNAQKIERAVRKAADRGAELLVVPECALSGYLPDGNLDFDALLEAQSGLLRCSSERAIWLALGTTTRRDGRLLNTALLFSPAGEIVMSYDKTHLTEADRDVFAPGQELCVIQVGEWKVGIQICFDMRFGENWRLLRLQGAEVVLHLSSASASAGWKVPVLGGTVRCRAAENGMFVVSANDARRPQMLVSAICDPDGMHLACAEENREMLITARLDRSAVKKDFLATRRTDLWSRPGLRDLLFS